MSLPPDALETVDWHELVQEVRAGVLSWSLTLIITLTLTLIVTLTLTLIVTLTIQVSPGVYSFHFFTEDFCDMLTAEVPVRYS